MKITTVLLSCLTLVGSSTLTYAATEKSADEIAKELSNPATSLASLNLNLQYQTFKGDLPGADDQDSWSMIFQPGLPFPVGDKGRNIVFRPAVPLLFDQPIFKADKGTFDDANVALGDIGFDLVYAGTEKSGLIWGVGAAGTLPTATDSDVGGKQWRFGPEVFGGISGKWGLVAMIVNNQWDVGGWDDEDYSGMIAQYAYAFGLGSGWQFTSSPVITYDWNADSDEALTLPLGVGLAKTTKIDNQAWKFAFQLQYFAVQPDAFGPEWLFKLTITPVVQNKLASLFK